MVPLILQFVIGLCPVSSYNLLCIRLVDLSPASPAAVTSANNLMRYLFRDGGAAIIIQKIKAMGRGWCITFLAAVLVLASPMLWVGWGSGVPKVPRVPRMPRMPRMQMSGAQNVVQSNRLTLDARTPRLQIQPCFHFPFRILDPHFHLQEPGSEGFQVDETYN